MLAWLSSRVRDWVVMTDELQYAKLATHIGETLSPLPVIRGAHVGAYAQLYPALIAPFYGTMSAPDAFRAAHVANGIVFASVVFPVYLLARRAALPRAYALACAALSVAVLWNVQAAFVMSEAVAYPAFAWGVLAIVYAVERATPRRDLLALLAIAVAVLARTQFVSLGVVFVIAALARDRRAHRVLWVATALALVVAIVGGSRVLGNYAVTAHGFPFPWRAFEQWGAHLDVIGVGLFLLPLLLGGAWLVTHARTAFGSTALATICVLTLEASSYDARFGGGLAGIRGRYVFYVAPLLLVAAARALAERRVDRRALGAVAAVVAVTSLAHGFPRVAGLYVDAPGAVLNDVIQDSGGRWFVALLALVVAALITRTPPRALAAATLAIVAVGAVSSSALAWTRLLHSHGPSSRLVDAKPTAIYDWIDSVLPKGAKVAIVPYAANGYWGQNALQWWDVEFWNRSVDRVLVVGPYWDYAPFPHQQVRIDRSTGEIARTAHAPPYLAISQGDARFGVAATATMGVNYGIAVYALDRPYHATWFSTGLDPDGWTEPGRAARVHVIGGGSANVTVLNGQSGTKTFCGTGDIALPNEATGMQPATPTGPSATGERAVGVRLISVVPGPACAT